MESVDLADEDEVEIQRLEACKADLQNRIAEESKENAVLLENLERRKRELHEHRQALEQDVARLQEQLQKEKDLRTALEAGLKISQGPSPISATIDEKVKADLEEIALTEADVTNLKQKVEDLSAQVNQQHEVNHSSPHECGVAQKTQNHQAKLKDKQKDVETTSASHLHDKSSRNKGSNSTTSALSKLTTRLNFLKERRTQIANEIQSMDKERHPNSGATAQNVEKVKGSEAQARQPPPKEDKSQASELQSVQSTEKGKGSDNSSSQSHQNQDKPRKSDTQPQDKPRKSDAQPQDKPRKSDAQPQQRPG